MNNSEDHFEKEKVSKHRLFFALWPDNDVRLQLSNQIKKVMACVVGKSVPEQNLHLTLSFMDAVDLSKIERIKQYADSIRLETCRILLNQTYYWPKSGILSLGCTNVPEALSNFVYKLNDGLRQCDIAASNRQFVPHVTLLRKVTQLSRDIRLEAISWQVSKFVLVESKTLNQGVSYTLLEEW